MSLQAHHFNFLAGVAVAGGWFYVTTSLPFYKWSRYLKRRFIVYKWFHRATYLTTQYQIFTHLLTGLTYLGVSSKYLPVPWGTRDDDTLTTFTFHNLIDIGNLGSMILCGANSRVYHGLLAFHLSSGCMALWNFSLFKSYVLDNRFSPGYTRVFKTFFVFLDAVLRSMALTNWRRR